MIAVVVDIMRTCCRFKASDCQGVVLDKDGAYVTPTGQWVYKCKRILSAGWLDYPCSCENQMEVTYLHAGGFPVCTMVGVPCSYNQNVDPSAQ